MEPSWDYNSGTESQKAPKTVTPTRGQESVMWFFWDRGLYTKWCITDSLKQSSSGPLRDPEGMFSFKVLSCWCWLSRYFCPWGEVRCIMQIYSAQWWGERKPKGRGNFLCLNFSCLATKYEFYSHYFTICVYYSGRPFKNIYQTSLRKAIFVEDT